MEMDTGNIEVVSLREEPWRAAEAVAYISSCWAEVPFEVYDDCVTESLYTPSSLPRWFVLTDGDDMVGCVGLITNDFISRMDLYPWVCALYVDEAYRRRGLAGKLLERCRREAWQAGYGALYLTTELRGYYERFGFRYIGNGFQPWGEAACIYRLDMKAARLLADGEYTVRPERQSDYGEVYDLIRTAFESARVKDGSEQDFAVMLREGDGYVPELALVAEYGGRLVAHIMLTETVVRQPDGEEWRGLLLAPVSVLKEHRGKALGAAIIGEALRRAAAMGFGVVFLVGDPGYYHRFGFRSAERYGITTRGDIPSRHVMVCELYPGALSKSGGQVDFC